MNSHHIYVLYECDLNNKYIFHTIYNKIKLVEKSYMDVKIWHILYMYMYFVWTVFTHMDYMATVVTNMLFKVE